MADDNTTELKIHIVSEADNKGFQQTADASKKLKVDTSDLSDETKRALGLMPQLSAATVKSGEAAAEASISHRELRRVLDEIGNVAAPGAGMALGELAFGPIGAALALAGAYEMIKKYLDDASDAADKFADTAAQPQTGGVKAIQTAWEDAAKSLADYYAKMKTAGEDEDPIATQIKNIKQISDARIEASKKNIEAIGQEIEAETRLKDVAAGKSKDQIDTDVQAVKDRIAAQIAALDQAKEVANGSAALLEEQKRRDAQADQLNKDAIDANARKFQADAKYNSDEAKLKADNDALNPKTPSGKILSDKKNAAQADKDAWEASPDYTTDGSTGTVTDNRPTKAAAIAQAQATLDAVNQEIANAKKEKDQLDNSQSIRDQAKKEAEDAAAAAAEASETNQKRRRQLPGEINQAQTVEGITGGGQQSAEAITAATRAIVANANAQSTEQLAQMQQAYAKAQQTIAQLAKSFNDATAAHDTTAAMIWKALTDLQASDKALAAKIASTGFNNR